jgi:ATP-dependent exoDNAse (exonuclease V) beta subunit
MAPVPAIGDDAGGSVGVYLKRLIAKRTANEQVRLLYVAATRSKRTLHLSAAPKVKGDGTIVPRAGTLLASLWPALRTDFEGSLAPQTSQAASASGRVGQSREDTPATAAGDLLAATREPAGAGATLQPPANTFRRLLAIWSPPPIDLPTSDLERLPVGRQSLEPPEFSWVGETSRHIGTVVHAALESFASAPELPTRARIHAGRDGYRHQLLRHGVPERDLARATEVVIEALTRTVEDERGRWIFGREHREAHSELALTGIAAGRLTGVVIDRSFVDRDGTRWVIDFKTSRHEGGGLEGFLEQEMARYRPQLESYVALARALGPEPVRAGLYFPLLGAFRELS